MVAFNQKKKKKEEFDIVMVEFNLEKKNSMKMSSRTFLLWPSVKNKAKREDFSAIQGAQTSCQVELRKVSSSLLYVFCDVLWCCCAFYWLSYVGLVLVWLCLNSCDAG